MILILSIPSDYSTYAVIEWIEALGGSYRRINESKFTSGDSNFEYKLTNSDNYFDDKNAPLALNEVTIVWFRRWLYQESFRNIFNLTENKIWASSIYDYIYKETNAFGNVFLSSIKNIRWFDNPQYVRGIKKMEVLTKAKEVGLLIPDTIITNNRESALEFLFLNDRIISKPITEIPYFIDEQYQFRLLTTEMTEDNLHSAPDHFYPTLFQKLIKKKYDIRVFFINDECYSMAILSQNDTTTMVDFRNYNIEHPSRTIPYKLPSEVENKICLLMKAINLSNGSLDFVLSQDQRYYFLEVNPVGQFGMTSYPCNYEIEKKIAQFLIKHDQERYEPTTV